MSTNIHAEWPYDTIANTRSNTDKLQTGVLSNNSDTNISTAQAEAFMHVNNANTLLNVHPIYKTINKSSGVETLLDQEFANMYANGTIYASEYIKHLGDTDTSIRFQDDDFEIYVGNIPMLDITEDDSQDIFAVNPEVGDVDFSVGASQFFVRGSDGYTAIGTDAPETQLEIFHVTAETAAIVYPLQVTVQSTGDGAAGLGNGVLFKCESSDSSGSTLEIGAVDFYWVNDNNVSAFQLKLWDTTDLCTVLQISPDAFALTRTDNGADGVVINTLRESTSPADADNLFELSIKGRDTYDAAAEYVNVLASISQPHGIVEATCGRLKIDIANDGDMETFLEMYGAYSGDGGMTICSHSGLALGFFGTEPHVRSEVTGSKGGNAALASLITALANHGLISDSTT